MPQDNEISKSRNEEQQQVNQPDPKTTQDNPGEDLMRSEENGASERRDPNETPDRKGETQNVKGDAYRET
ncbi:MAG: hypothetical protein ACXWCZ_00660 [Flavisolibacter sp.]